MPNHLAKQWMYKVLSVAGQTNETACDTSIDRICIYCVCPVVVLLITYTQEQEQSGSNSDQFSYLVPR